MGVEILGEAAGDQSGVSMSLSADGKVVAIGSITNDGITGLSTDNRGHVRVFAWNDSSWVQRGADIDGAVAGDNAGIVSINSDGTVVAIGGYFHDAGNASTDNRGYVRIFAWNGTSWDLRGQSIIGEATTDQTGYAVSISANGNTVAIGAPSNDAGGSTPSNRGHVRIFDWNGTAWTQRGLDIDGVKAGDIAGYAISLSANGNVVAIGEPGYDIAANDNRGQCRVFSWNGAAWDQLGQSIVGSAAGESITASASGGISGNLCTVSLSATGTILALGAPLYDISGSADIGVARIYELINDVWVQRGADIPGTRVSDRAGASVKLSADGAVVAVGVQLYDGPGSNPSSTNNQGTVRVYEWNGSIWYKINEQDILGSSLGDSFGYSVGLSSDGNIVACGALGRDIINSSNADNRGGVRVFSLASNLNVSLVSIEGSSTIQFQVDPNYYGLYPTDISINIDAPASSSYNSTSGRVNITTVSSAPGSVLTAEFTTTDSNFVGPSTRSVSIPTIPLTLAYSSKTTSSISFTVTSTPLPANLSKTAGSGSLSYNATTGDATVSGLSANTSYTFGFNTTDAAYNGVAITTASVTTDIDVPVVVPCFLGSARVKMADGSWCRLRDLREGDEVAGGAVTRVVCKTVTASAAVNPYVIPAGQLGARRRLLISPSHRVAVPGRGLIEAQELGLAQEAMEGAFDYYNVEITGNGNMNVEGVEVESLAPVRRIVMTKEKFIGLVGSKYAGRPLAEVLRLVDATCRMLPGGRVECPVIARR
jgi:hypothetical protein